MKFQRFDLNECEQATGTAVVIDVLRAFTTAAYAFARGAESIILVAEVDEALQLKAEDASRLLVGEVGGYPIEGFDLGNSPTAVAGADLAGKQLVQRTSSGTQGVVRCTEADEIVTGSFACASAIVTYLKQKNPAIVSFINTGARPNRPCEEDAACADYLEALLTDQQPDPAPYVQRVRTSINGRLFTNSHEPAFPESDLEFATAVDAFVIVMKVQHQDGLHILRPYRV